MEVKLAEALLRRKELQQKVDQLRQIREKDFFEIHARRQSVQDGIDDVVAKVPLLSASQVTHEYDWYARQLRLVDAAIQQTNWTAGVSIADSVMSDYTPPKDLRR